MKTKLSRRRKKVSVEGKPTVNLRVLDKITAKTKDFQIAIGKKKEIWIFRDFTKKM